MGTIAREDLERYLADMRDRGLAPATVAKHYRSLHQLFKCLSDDGETARSPIERIVTALRYLGNRSRSATPRRTRHVGTSAPSPRSIRRSRRQLRPASSSQSSVEILLGVVLTVCQVTPQRTSGPRRSLSGMRNPWPSASPAYEDMGAPRD